MGEGQRTGMAVPRQRTKEPSVSAQKILEADVYQEDRLR